MADPVERSALYVSSVEGCPVTRFGTRTLIGATRSAQSPSVVSFETEKVVAIPFAEYERFQREYDRALGNGSLKARKPAEWEQQQKTRRDAQAKQKADRDAAATRRKEAEQGEGTPSAPDTPAQE